MILKAKEYTLGVLNRGRFVYTKKNQNCLIWKKNRKDALLNGVEEIEKKFKYVKNKINDNNLNQNIRY